MQMYTTNGADVTATTQVPFISFSLISCVSNNSSFASEIIIAVWD